MGNLGTILRSCLGFGMKDIAIIKPGVDIFDPKVVRASMGSIFSLNISYFNSFEDYKNALVLKLQEEVQEYIEAEDEPSQIEELADIYEVLDAICVAYNIQDKVADFKVRKAKVKGKFERRIFLEKVDKRS